MAETMHAPYSPPRIFISYSRSDGEEFARNLRRRLIEEYGFVVWQDRTEMQVGEAWWQQIVAALTNEYVGDDACCNGLKDGAQGMAAIAITVTLRGAGGYGKTTLAKTFCHDEHILEAFYDGILGETPSDPTWSVKDLIEILSGERSGFAGLDAASSHLIELLADRHILIVIDDVWNGAHLKPFVRGHFGCRKVGYYVGGKGQYIGYQKGSIHWLLLVANLGSIHRTPF